MMLDPWYSLHSLFDEDSDVDMSEDEQQSEQNAEVGEGDNTTLEADSLSKEETQVNEEDTETAKDAETSSFEESEEYKRAMLRLAEIKAQCELDVTKLKDYADHRTTRLSQLVFLQKWVRHVVHRNLEHFHQLDVGMHRTSVGNLIVHLNALLLQLDAVESHGIAKVRQYRKSLVKEIEDGLTLGEKLLKRVDKLVYLKERMNVVFSEPEATKPATQTEIEQDDDKLTEKEAGGADGEAEPAGSDGEAAAEESDDEDMESDEEEIPGNGNATEDEEDVPEQKRTRRVLPQPTFETESRQDCILITVELPILRMDRAVKTTLEHKADHDVVRVHDRAGRFRDLALDIKRDSLNTDSIEQYHQGCYLVLKVPRKTQRRQWARHQRAPAHLPRTNRPSFYQPRDTFFPSSGGFFGQPQRQSVWGW